MISSTEEAEPKKLAEPQYLFPHTEDSKLFWLGLGYRLLLLAPRQYQRQTQEVPHGPGTREDSGLIGQNRQRPSSGLGKGA